VFREAAEFLQATGWLSERPAATRRLILDAAKLVRFGANETVYHMGDPADGVYGFVTGGLRVLMPSEDGEVVTVHVTEPGFWVGDSAFFASSNRLISLVTVQPVVALHVSQISLRTLVEEHPGLNQDFFALSHRNLATALRLLANLAIASSQRRIALRLLHYEELSGAPGGWLDLNQSDLTRLLAVSLPTVQRVLRRMSTAGAIEVGYGRLRIIDRKKLIGLCSDEVRAGRS
jgi:CRP-like cAMP-binding protein